MIEDYINNFELEFPVYNVVQNYDAIYYRKPSMLKKMVDAANSYKNSPPYPFPKKGKIIPCATLRLKSSLKNIAHRRWM